MGASVARLHEIMEEQNAYFINRSEEISALVLALLSKQHMFLLGPPGVGKSMLANDFTKRIKGAMLFVLLMRKDTKFEELFGPVSLKALENDIYKYITAGRLAEAHIAFLDEPFKSSSTALNALLTAMNERIFDNEGKRHPMPLITLIGASNELPEGNELAALYDRFLIRLYVQDLKTEEDFIRLLKLSSEPSRKNTITLDELQAYHTKVEAVDVNSIAQDIADLQLRIRAEAGLVFSSRRWKQAQTVIQAHAFLAGREAAEKEDLEIFKWVLWNNLEERTKINRIVLSLVNPLNEEFLDLEDSAEQIYQNIVMEVARNNPEVASLGNEASNKMHQIQKRLQALLERADGNMKNRILDARKRNRTYLKYILQNAIGVEIDIGEAD